MTSKKQGLLFALIVISVVVSMDLLFFRDRFLERLLANIGVVLVFALIYLRLKRKS